MGQAQINVRTRACSRTSIARTRQAALTHNVRGKELKMGQAQINVRTRACSGTFIARTKQAALTHNVRGKRLIGRLKYNSVRLQKIPS